MNYNMNMKKRLSATILNRNLRQIITLLLLKVTETSSENISEEPELKKHRYYSRSIDVYIKKRE